MKPSSLEGMSTTQLVMRVTVNGYLMAMRSWCQYLCVVVILTYNYLNGVVPHDWVKWIGQTSKAWDSIPHATV
jgi:hypothetical protein